MTRGKAVPSDQRLGSTRGTWAVAVLSVAVLVLLGVAGVLTPSTVGASPSPAATPGGRSGPRVAPAGLASDPWSAKGRADPVWSAPTPRSAATATGPWTLESTANPTVPSGTLTADTCVSTSCTAVGDHVDATGDLVTWAERRSGSSWTLESTPDPPGAVASELLGVVCPSADACTAVGFSTSGAGVTSTLVETWNGGGWTIQPSPDPPDTSASGLVAVACASPVSCQAVGEATTNAGGSTSFAEGWDGTMWSVETVPQPAGSTGSRLLGVSCPTAGACTAVGGYGDPAGVGLTLAETWNGTSWTIQSTPNPVGAEGSGLLGVSCPSATSCTGVGSSDTNSGTTLTLAEGWNGTTWTIQSTPNPPGASEAALNSVSCVLGTCTAAGYSAAPAHAALPLAEAWDGTSWAVQTVPGPSGATAGGFLAVSCASTSSCVAVGSYDRGSNSIPVPLVEGVECPDLECRGRWPARDRGHQRPEEELVHLGGVRRRRATPRTTWATPSPWPRPGTERAGASRARPTRPAPPMPSSTPCRAARRAPAPLWASTSRTPPVPPSPSWRSGTGGPGASELAQPHRHHVQCPVRCVVQFVHRLHRGGRRCHRAAGRGQEWHGLDHPDHPGPGRLDLDDVLRRVV